MLQWESINELNAFRLLDCDPNVTVFTEQPCEIVYVDGREIKHHYPDIYVEIDGEQEFWEVKAECEAAQNEVASRTELLSRGLQRYGFTYRVVLDRELAKQQRLENAKTLLRYGRLAASDGEREYIRGAVESKGSLNWAEISLCSPSSSSLLTKQQQHNRRQSDVRCGRAQMMKVRLENVKVRTLKDEMELNYWKQ